MGVFRVIPVKTGIQGLPLFAFLDSRLRGNDNGESGMTAMSTLNVDAIALLLFKKLNRALKHRIRNFLADVRLFKQQQLLFIGDKQRLDQD